MNVQKSHKLLALFALTVVAAAYLAISLLTAYGDVLLFIVAAIVLVNMAVAFVALAGVIRVLRTISAAAEEISRGNYDVVVTPRGGEETRRFIQNFNATVTSLKSHGMHLTHRAYQNAILKEITDRISPSLDANDALEIISGSLGKVVSYSTASYLSYDQNGKLLFKCHLEESVSRAFADDARKKTLAAFTLLTGQKVEEQDVRTVHFGTIFDDQSSDPVRAYFNLPMVVGDRVVGIINVASRRATPYVEAETEILYSIVAQTGATITRIKTLIQEETSKIRSMLASIAEGIIMVTTAQEVALINTKAKEILGIKAKENPSMLDVIQALYGKLDFRTASEKVLMSQLAESFPELTVENTVYKVSAGPVRNTKGEMLGVVFIFFDITREKEIDKMKSEFISVTSHQLRTPLSSMKWFLEMLINNDLGELPEKQRNVVVDIYNSNERVITLVNDLLDVSRIESGKIMIEPTPTDLIAFFKSMLPEVESQFKKRNQTFEFKKPDSVPRISVDPRLIWQVAQNLLTNASKYTPEGGRVALELSLTDKNMLIAVQDNGYGIPEFQKHRIFEKFFRADNISKMEGTGLGLYIAKEIAEASGGTLWFESTEGRGTTFYLTLPLEGSKPGRVGENKLF